MGLFTVILILYLCSFAASNNHLQWTWMAGNTLFNQQGAYGEKGNVSTDNYPGGRHGALGWCSVGKDFM